MRIEIQEGYDVVLHAENEADRKRIEKLYEKYLKTNGLEADLLGVPGYYIQLKLRPKRLPHEHAELKGVDPISED